MGKVWNWLRNSDSYLAIFVNVCILTIACMVIVSLIHHYTGIPYDAQAEEVKELKSEIKELRIEVGSLEAKLNSIDIPDDTNGVDEDGID